MVEVALLYHTLVILWNSPQVSNLVSVRIVQQFNLVRRPTLKNKVILLFPRLVYYLPLASPTRLRACSVELKLVRELKVEVVVDNLKRIHVASLGTL